MIVTRLTGPRAIASSHVSEQLLICRVKRAQTTESSRTGGRTGLEMGILSP